ncbi:MAG TPA: pyridoxal phosphate-dependent aminotransferase [Terriglobales bacterium]|nr:pyridoxal phosphate-dependent aminotransferase [Terriglobales bacterium]
MFALRTAWDLSSNRLAVALADARRLGREVLDLTESNPARCGFEYDQPAILAALAQPASLDYRPEPLGLLSARQAVAGYYRDRGEEVSADRILLTTSTSEAYSFLFRLLCDPDYEVLIPRPSYPLFEFLAGLQDVRLTPYPLFYDHGWHLDRHALESALSSRTRALVVVHPNNPTGSFVPPAEAEYLARLCADRGLALIADEVFLDFPLTSAAPRSFATQTAALTFTLSGLSKLAGLPQMKVAWVVISGPPGLARPALDRLEVIADTYLSMSTPILLALPHLLETRHRFLAQARPRLTTNLDELDRRLAAQSLVQRLELEGGWYVVLRVPAHQPDEDLALALLGRHGVLLHPGHFYDFPSEGHLVLSLLTPPDIFAEGLRRTLAHLSASS